MELHEHAKAIVTENKPQEYSLKYYEEAIVRSQSMKGLIHIVARYLQIQKTDLKNSAPNQGKITIWNKNSEEIQNGTLLQRAGLWILSLFHNN
jgi:hypothetical protein